MSLTTGIGLRTAHYQEITDIIKGHWKEIKGQLKQQWGKLTDDDLIQIEGSYDKLQGSLQK